MKLAYRACDPFSLWMEEPLLTLSGNNVDYTGQTGLPFPSDLNERIKRAIFGIIYHEKPGAVEWNKAGDLEFVLEVPEVNLDIPEAYERFWKNGGARFKPLFQEVTTGSLTGQLGIQITLLFRITQDCWSYRGR